jgi:UDP-N-acetylmuramoyl-L-alanyl-D-glutamate--2,6-diaminopimelate ligase
MMLRELAAAVDGARVLGPQEIAIDGVTADSRAVVAGDAFVALRGERSDGHAFVAQAYERGAAAAIVERESPFPNGRAQVVVHDSRRAGSRIAARFFGDPSRALTVVGITGTNGKTTTAYLVRAVLDAAGERCATIGTLGVEYGGDSAPLANTTPPAIELQKILAGLRERGATAVGMEVSSHALALERVEDVAFDVGVLTNITRDHLDFHGTHEAYVAAKRRLFDLAGSAVLNTDDPAGIAFARELRVSGRPVVTYALDAEADVGPALLEPLALPGRFNVANALAALGVARALGLDLRRAAAAIAAVRTVPGRMERFSAGGVEVIVDYAHTPDALANVLRALRGSTRGRLVAVFGCGGDRDAGKRPEMGAVAAALADRVIVTSDNPRSEDPMAIAQAVAAPIGGTIVLDRRAAIRRAIEEASAGDVVVVAGKGHEAYQIVGEERHPFDDREEVRGALRARGALAP